MNLLDIVRRQPVPEPWSEGEKIPWNETGFSQRMLLEHLSQEHDAASRRFPTIDRHVEWIHHTILAGQPARILDLGCGPGLYASRLARLGHECVGIDFSPASMNYARECARVDNLRCTYLEQDIRVADYGHGYELVMFVYGELNVFRRGEARSILERAHQALVPGGHLLLEVHTLSCVRAIGQQPATWYSAGRGLFSDLPHLYLTESFWDARQNVASQRYFIVDAATGRATRYAASTQGYTEQEYQSWLEECGFRDVVFHPSLHGEPDASQQGLVAIVCQKGEAVKFEAMLLRESLKDDGVLLSLHITRSEVWHVRNAGPFQPSTWTALWFEGDESQADATAQTLSESLHADWYCNIVTDRYSYVVFGGKVFKYIRGDKQGRAEAQAYGRLLGVPESQLDWGEGYPLS